MNFKTLTFVALTAFSLNACSNKINEEHSFYLGPSAPEVKPELDPTRHTSVDPTQISVEDHLINLMIAQNNFYKLTGRWSMTIDTLVKSDFLRYESGLVLSNQIKIEGWKFSEVALPFSDEDVSWCYSAHGPNGRLILASHKGLWERHDGQLSMEIENLPPKKPWVKISK